MAVLRGAVGRERGRGLLPGDLPRGAARLSEAGRRRQPARLAADDRPPQGDRPPPRQRPPAGPGRGGRRGRGRGTRSPTTASGPRSAPCRRSSGPRSPCATPPTSPTPRSPPRWAARRRPPAAACTRASSDCERSWHEGVAEPARRARRRGGPARRRLHDAPTPPSARCCWPPPARPGPGRAARTRTPTSSWPTWPSGSRRGCSRPRPALDEARRELDLYFEGRLTASTCPRLAAHRRLPRPGAAGDRPHPLRPDPQLHADGEERRQRARGPRRRHRLRLQPDLPLVVPCHRVLRSGGALGGYGGGLPMKEALLRLEGVLENPHALKGSRPRPDSRGMRRRHTGTAERSRPSRQVRLDDVVPGDPGAGGDSLAGALGAGVEPHRSTRLPHSRGGVSVRRRRRRRRRRIRSRRMRRRRRRRRRMR